MKKQKKTAEEKAMNGEMANLVKYIIAATFARHSQLSEEEYLKEIGFEGSGKTEDEAVRIAMFNVLTETTSEFLKTINTIKMTHGLMKTLLIDEKITEEGKGE